MSLARERAIMLKERARERENRRSSKDIGSSRSQADKIDNGLLLDADKYPESANSYQK
jgi:hypothetical protein